MDSSSRGHIDRRARSSTQSRPPIQMCVVDPGRRVCGFVCCPLEDGFEYFSHERGFSVKHNMFHLIFGFRNEKIRR